MGKYDDIIDLPHHQSETREHMTMRNRAAQFAPFAALTGYGDSIKEEERYTEEKAELSPSKEEELNEAIGYLMRNIQDCPIAEVTYFTHDMKKTGGKYTEREGKIKKVDLYRNRLIFDDGTEILFEDIYDIRIPGKE